MRHEKAQSLLHLARVLAGSAEGLTLDEMAEVAGTGRRTVERMRDALEVAVVLLAVKPEEALREAVVALLHELAEDVVVAHRLVQLGDGLRGDALLERLVGDQIADERLVAEA